MASAFDNLLTNLVDRLQKVGVGSGTAAENRAKIDYMTASNRAAQAGQATPRDYAYFYGNDSPQATSLSNNVNTYGNNQAVGTGGGYSLGNKPKRMFSDAEVLAGAVPDPLDEYRLNQLQIEQNIRDQEDAAAPKDQGFGQSTLERQLYDAKIAEDRRRRQELVENNISIERRANEERRMIQEAEANQKRQSILDSGGMDMPYKGQGENSIDLDPIVLNVDLENPPTNTEIVRLLEQDYADLAAAGADTAALSELAREIDSYRDRQSSLPSIVSEAAASDVVELNGASLLDQEDTYSPFGSPRLSPALMESIIEGEGDTLTNDPNDEGGATKFGIAYNFNTNELKNWASRILFLTRHHQAVQP